MPKRNRLWVFAAPVAMFLALPFVYRFFESTWLGVGILSEGASAAGLFQSAVLWLATAVLALEAYNAD